MGGDLTPEERDGRAVQIRAYSSPRVRLCPGMDLELCSVLQTLARPPPPNAQPTACTPQPYHDDPPGAGATVCVGKAPRQFH